MPSEEKVEKACSASAAEAVDRAVDRLHQLTRHLQAGVERRSEAANAGTPQPRERVEYVLHIEYSTE